MCTWSLSRVWLSATPWAVAHQAPPSMGFSRQEYWSGLPFPSPEDLTNPGIEPGFCFAGRFFTIWARGKLYVEVRLNLTHAVHFLWMSLTDRNLSRQTARAGHEDRPGALQRRNYTKKWCGKLVWSVAGTVDHSLLWRTVKWGSGEVRAPREGREGSISLGKHMWFFSFPIKLNRASLMAQW